MRVLAPTVVPKTLAEALGTFEGKRVDLTIRNTSEYFPKDTEQNRKLCRSDVCDDGRTLFQLNLLGDRRTNFEFCFSDAQNDPITPGKKFCSGHACAEPDCPSFQIQLQFQIVLNLGNYVCGYLFLFFDELKRVNK